MNFHPGQNIFETFSQKKKKEKLSHSHGYQFSFGRRHAWYTVYVPSVRAVASAASGVGLGVLVRAELPLLPRQRWLTGGEQARALGDSPFGLAGSGQRLEGAVAEEVSAGLGHEVHGHGCQSSSVPVQILAWTLGCVLYRVWSRLKSRRCCQVLYR